MNLFEAPSFAVSDAQSEYNNAVNASRFVKGFGVAALIYSVLLFLGINLLSSAIGIGTGLFIFRYDEGRFYRVLGAAVMVLALVAPLLFLSPGVLASSVLYKGTQILGVLNRSPQDDPDWRETRSRTMVGLAGSGIGLLASLVMAILEIIAIGWLIAKRMH